MSFPQWKGLWDWSIKYADGTTPSGFRPEDVDPEKMQWLEAALKHYMVDLSARMREIKTKLERDTPAAATTRAGDQGDQGDDQAGPDAALEEREALLDELMDIVSSIDYARDLHKIGGLPVLLELLDSPQPSLRWRAAEVVATCVANNPPVQQWFLDGGVLPRLLHLAGPAEPATVRTKAVLALSGLVRHFDAGLQALRAAGGLATIISCVSAPDRRLARKAMTTLAYMLGQRRADCAAALADGALPPLAAALDAGGAASTGDADDSDLRQAALAALTQLASFPATWAAVRDAPGLRPRLAALEAAHAALPPEDAEAQAEELGALRRLSALLAATTAPAAPPPDEGGGITAAQFEESGQDLTITVNEPAAVAADGARRQDAGAGRGDQGGAGTGAAGDQRTEAGQGQPAAAPLLLGAP